MRRDIFIACLSAALALGGCAFREAIDSGHALAAAQSYRAALEQYERAQRLDDDDSARRYAEQIKPYAITQAKEELKQSLDNGEYEAALAHAGYVERLDSAQGTQLQELVLTNMKVGVRVHIAKGAWDEAYDLALRARRSFPKDAAIEREIVAVRKHFFDECEALTAQGRYPEALARLDFVASKEPESKWLQDDIAARRQRVRVAWADSVVERAAKELKQKHRGAAAALYARAFELAGRERDVEAMREQTRILRREAAFILLVSGHGEDEAALRRGSLLARLTKEELATSPGMAFADDRDDGVTMVVSLRAGEPQCAEQFSARQAQQPYVAGMRDVSNPEHERIRIALQTSHESVARLQGQVVGLDADIARLDQQVKRCHLARGSIDEQARIARRDVAAASSEVERLRERIERIERELRQSRGEQKKRLAEQLEQAHNELRQAEGKLAQAQAALSHIEGQQRAASCSDGERALDEAQRLLAMRKAELAAEQVRAGTLANDLARTPKTVSEPVMDVFHYEVKDFTRACASSGQAAFEAAWTSAERVDLHEQKSTTDSTNDAYPQYGVAADPLRFPQSDELLVDGANRALAQTVASAVRERARRYYRNMAERAQELVTKDRDAATDMMVALLLAGKSYLDAATVARFDQELERLYGLESLSTLDR
jgi:hypothetical protein